MDGVFCYCKLCFDIFSVKFVWEWFVSRGIIIMVDYCEAVSHYEQIAKRIANNRLSVSVPVSDNVSNMVNFRHFGGTVNIKPFGQLGTMEYRHGRIIYTMEALESLIGFIQIRIGLQELCNPFFDHRRKESRNPKKKG